MPETKPLLARLHSILAEIEEALAEMTPGSPEAINLTTAAQDVRRAITGLGAKGGDHADR